MQEDDIVDDAVAARPGADAGVGGGVAMVAPRLQHHLPHPTALYLYWLTHSLTHSLT